MKFFYTLLFLCVSFLLKAQVITSSQIGTPDQVHCNVPVRLNNIVFGAVPPGSEDKPVLVFSHGWFDNGYSFFMMHNKWYENAYNAGYRTAFFFQSTSGAFEDNGKVIADMIRETCRHYSTEKIIAVCHSKGGFDMEYALYNSGIWDSVQGVITLSTPFWGAPMSDMISVPLFRSILEIIPGVGLIFQGKGSYQMQTAYMAGVARPMLDNHPDNHPEKFHCFGAWGHLHKTVLPDDIPDDAIRVLQPQYVSSCQPAGSLVHMFMEGLFSESMRIIGDLSNLVQVQPKYNNPQHNQIYMDGLSPYYSAIRPGSVMVSQEPPDSSSYLNHLDMVWADVVWDRVFREIEYFKNNPVHRQNNTMPTNPNPNAQPVSNSSLIQSKTISINTSAENKLYVVGDYKNEKIDVLNENNQVVKTIPLNFSTQGMLDVFHAVDLSALLSNKKYTLKSSKELVGFLQDGSSASIRLNAHSDQTYYAEEPLNMEVSAENWTDDLSTTTVTGYLNRNMNENDDVIHDKIIPVTFGYDVQRQAFVCKDKIALESGVYNLSVFAEGSSLKRFVTTSLLLKQERKTNTNTVELSVFPNPANDMLNIRFMAENKDYSFEVFDVLGKKIAEKKLGKVEGFQNVQFNIKENGFANGVYMISLVANGERVGEKVAVVE